MSKYRNVRTELDGYKFDSKREAGRYAELKILARAGLARDLAVHPVYPIEVNGFPICKYEADFFYRDERGLPHVEDVKGVRTDVYRIKKKLVKALLGIEIQEV